MLAGGLAEVLSLGLVVPFLAAMAAPQKLLSHPNFCAVFNFLSSACEKLGLSKSTEQLESHNPVIILGATFILGSFFAGAIRLLLVWLGVRLTAAVGTDLGLEAYRRTLYQPYSFHTKSNSSYLISSLISKITLLIFSFAACLTFLTSLVMCFFIICALLLISLQTTLIAILSLGIAYGVLTLMSHRKLAACSLIISRENQNMVKLLQEGLGGIRDILLDGTQTLYSSLYTKADAVFRRANANIAIIGQVPRHIMETIGMVFFAVLAIGLSQQPQGLATALPIVGALALGIQRLLPSLQHGFQAWSIIVGSQDSNQEVISLLKQPLPKWVNQPLAKPLSLRRDIRFDSVKFRYCPTGSWVLGGVSFVLPKGSRIGFVGETGSGKSTCLDLLMGLLEPSEGRILIDGVPLGLKNRRAWQRNISHVPQAVFLSDSTLAENIALGIPRAEINMARVRDAARQAQIEEFIEASPAGYQTTVGERGIRLSGGQRQRIGIARALYKQAGVLVLDEATSALDKETEGAVMKSIMSLGSNVTILIIAHRTSTLKNCDQIIHLRSKPGKKSALPVIR